MQTLRWYHLLAGLVLAVPIAARGQVFRPAIRQLGVIPETNSDDDEYSDDVLLPNGRVLLYTSGDSIFAYDLTTKRITLITRGYRQSLIVSRAGDRIAFAHRSEDKDKDYIWSMAINSQTGAPAGAPQRVSTSPAGQSAFSPDGTQIAFEIDRGNSHDDLALVSATGGPERILAKYDKTLKDISWSDDGKWVYALFFGIGQDTVKTLQRVPAGGGPSTVVWSLAHAGNADAVLDARVVVFGPDFRTPGVGQQQFRDGQKWYQSKSGERGMIQLPTGSVQVSVQDTKMLVEHSNEIRPLRVVDLSTGVVRTLPVQAPSGKNLSWSPDDKHLAFATDLNEHLELVVMNVDGSGQRRFSVPGGADVRDGASFWAPDGAGLVYGANGGRDLWFLNVATGAARRLTTLPDGFVMSWPGFWQPDGKAFVARIIEANATRPGPTWHPKIIEVTLSGTQRVLRDLASEFSGIIGSVLLSNRSAEIALGDTSARRFVVVPLDGAAPHPVTMPALGPGLRGSTVAAPGDPWFGASILKGTQIAGIEVISTGSDSARVVQYPHTFESNGLNFFSADGKHLIKISKTARADSESTIYSIPLDGSPWRIVGKVPSAIAGLIGWDSGVSADRKYFAFFTDGTSVTNLYEADLSPLLKTAVKH